LAESRLFVLFLVNFACFWKNGHDLWMELVAGTIAEEVLVLDSVNEEGVGFTGRDQSFAGAVAGHVEPSIAVVLRGLLLRPLLSRQ
jgi:hypothetical protein